MHPIAKCCGYYCSCILVVSIIFFGILIALLESGNMWLVRNFNTPDGISERVDSLVLAIIVNGICAALCILCIVIGRVREGKLKSDDEDEFDIQLGTYKMQ